MPFRRMIVASLLTVSALVAVSLIALHRMPAGATLPTHWGADGQPDGYMAAPDALFVAPAIAAVISLLMVVVPRIEPLQRDMERSAVLYETAWGLMLALTIGIEAMVAAPAFGFALPGTLAFVGVGLMLIVMGNALPKSRPGFFVGIRTPWTLIDPDNWIATHRLGGWTTIAAGVVMVVAGVLPIGAAVRVALLFTAIGLITTPILYSWWYWRTRRAG